MLDTALPAISPTLESAAQKQPVYQYQNGLLAASSHEDILADEVPVALQYNGLSHVVMLASAVDLVDLAYGFSFTEGIIRRPGDIYDCELIETDQGYVLDITIATACLQQLKQRRRRMTGQTGCGLCGIESLQALEQPLPQLTLPAQPLALPAIEAALAELAEKQPLRALTGATHAAAWANTQGNLQVVREDVGRHNALDKLIGHLLRQGAPDAEYIAAEGMVVVSSRASYEMVQKTLKARIPALIAVSAPTAMAVETARAHQLILIGFARQGRLNIYHGQTSLSATPARS